MLFIVLLVCFTVVMLVWLLGLLGAVPGGVERQGWLAFFAVLVLGIVVFLVGSGAHFVRAP